MSGRPGVPGWAWRSAAASSRPMAGEFGANPRGAGAAAPSSSPYRCGATMSSELRPTRRAASGRAERDSRKSHLPLVLVVEDDVQLRRLIRRSLELEDFRVIEAQDGATALELASTQHLAMI